MVTMKQLETESSEHLDGLGDDAFWNPDDWGSVRKEGHAWLQLLVAVVCESDRQPGRGQDQHGRSCPGSFDHLQVVGSRWRGGPGGAVVASRQL